MKPVSLILALLMSLVVPGFGLVKTKDGPRLFFMGYLMVAFLLVPATFATMGVAGFLGYPLMYFVGLCHTYFAVRGHNGEVIGAAAQRQEMADLREQISNLQN